VIAPPVFLDANVFMYAAGAVHQYKAPCVRILTDVEAGKLPAVINTEILQEILYRYSHIGLAEKGVSLCREILKYPLVDLPVTDADIRLAVDLFDVHRAMGVKPRDAVHAATMQNNGITHAISADGHFDRFTFITRIDPLAYTPSS
jgi:predicted nucleic acid-binding protein